MMLLCRMYTIVRRDWPISKKIYLLEYLYTFYLRSQKPLIINKTGPSGKTDKKAAMEFIMKLYELNQALEREDDDVAKKALVDEAKRHHRQTILGMPPLAASIAVEHAIEHLTMLLGRIRALGQLIAIELY